jgi:flagellar hook-associated protein 2
MSTVSGTTSAVSTASTSSTSTSATTFSGLATGIDTDSIVTKLMTIERLPITRLKTKDTSEANRLAAYAQFKGTIDDLKTAVSAMNVTSQVKSTSVFLSTDAPFTATSTNASSGSYNIAVEQLAQVQKNISSGFSSQTDSVLGTGTFTLTNGTQNTVISVSSTNNSLSGLAAAINEHFSTSGVKATIINDGTTGSSAYRMVFTGTDATTNFSLSSTLTGGTTSFTATPVQTAKQAKILVDGTEVVSNSNTFSGTISGITLNINAVSDSAPGSPPYKISLLEIKPDTNTLKEKITTFVTSYNKVMNWILSGYPEISGSTATDTTSTELLGSVLRGDSTVNGIKRGIQSVLSSVIKNTGSLRVLSQIGISTNLDGTLNQNNTKLDAALQNNFDSTVSLLAGEGSVDGIMKKMNYYLLDVTNGSTGMYASKKKSYAQITARIEDQIAKMEPRMVKKEATLRAQYTTMEKLISGLNAQSSFLTQQMDLLSNMLKG